MLTQQITEPHEGRLVRRLLIQRNARELAERKPVGQRIFKPRIGKIVPLRQQKRLEQAKRRIARRPTARIAQGVKQAVKPPPVNKPKRPLKLVLALADPFAQKVIRKPNLPVMPSRHIKTLHRINDLIVTSSLLKGNPRFQLFRGLLWRPLNFQDSLHIRSFPAGAGGMFDHSGRQFRRFQPVLPDLATSRRTPPVDCHTRLRLRRRL